MTLKREEIIARTKSKVLATSVPRAGEAELAFGVPLFPIGPGIAVEGERQLLPGTGCAFTADLPRISHVDARRS